jgi:hypothetical protein
MSEKCDLPAETAAKANEECDKECEWRRVKPLTPFDRYNSSLHSPLSMKSAMKPIRIALQYYKLSRFMYTSTPTIVTTDGSTHPSLCSNRIFPRKLLSSNLTLFILFSLERDCVQHANVASAVRFRPPNATVSTGSDAYIQIDDRRGCCHPISGCCRVADISKKSNVRRHVPCTIRLLEFTTSASPCRRRLRNRQR